VTLEVNREFILWCNFWPYIQTSKSRTDTNETHTKRYSRETRNWTWELQQSAHETVDYRHCVMWNTILTTFYSKLLLSFPKTS